ncbi:MAG: alanine:cation symporter family protein [Phycisphaeraceae bacterium]|nr:alanine:cation symporter family protein [Phycisphaeraceae bacterium]
MNRLKRPAESVHPLARFSVWPTVAPFVLGILLALPAEAQDTETGASEFGLPLVTNVQPPAGDPSLGDHFDSTLSTINGFVYGTLFRDVSFGAFQSEELDERGDTVYEINAVEVEAEVDFEAILTTRSGLPIVKPNGEYRTIVIQKGATYQPVSEPGKPDTEQGDPKITGPTAPFLVVFLALGAIFFTLWHGFINIRGFKHAIDIVRGKFSRKDDEGEIPPFRALTSALSATVGLGNIAGVAIAVKLGGPGAIFWMMFLGLFGMTAKFHESSLAQMFRIKNSDGSVSGGPMYYLDHGFKKINHGMGAIGKTLAIIFAIFCMGASLGGGNMFQSNQAFEGFYSQFVESDSLAEQRRGDLPIEVLRPLLRDNQLSAAAKGDLAGKANEIVRTELSEERVRAILLPSQIEKVLDEEAVAADTAQRETLKGRVSIGFGLIFATLVGIVVVGGITRIGAATSKIVPAMCLLYVLGCLIVIMFNLGQVPSHVALIFDDAFAKESAYGGLVGVLIIGFQRAAFSSEAGLGSSAIAHSAAKQKEPIREGFVASLEPFIDTIVICFMTAMVVLITDAYIAPELVEESNGSAITLFAFEQTRVGAWFPWVLSVSIVLFAFSTMISWCYYGERAWGYLIGLKSVIVFRLIFVACVFVGAVASLGPVIDFADAMLLTMALPNIIGGVILAKLVKRELKSYWARYKAGEITGPDPDPDQSGSDI